MEKKVAITLRPALYKKPSTLGFNDKTLQEIKNLIGKAKLKERERGVKLEGKMQQKASSSSSSSSSSSIIVKKERGLVEGAVEKEIILYDEDLLDPHLKILGTSRHHSTRNPASSSSLFLNPSTIGKPLHQRLPVEIMWIIFQYVGRNSPKDLCACAESCFEMANLIASDNYFPAYYKSMQKGAKNPTGDFFPLRKPKNLSEFRHFILTFGENCELCGVTPTVVRRTRLASRQAPFEGEAEDGEMVRMWIWNLLACQKCLSRYTVSSFDMEEMGLDWSIYGEGLPCKMKSFPAWGSLLYNFVWAPDLIERIKLIQEEDDKEGHVKEGEGKEDRIWKVDRSWYKGADICRRWMTELKIEDKTTLKKDTTRMGRTINATADQPNPAPAWDGTVVELD